MIWHPGGRICSLARLAPVPLHDNANGIIPYHHCDNAMCGEKKGVMFAAPGPGTTARYGRVGPREGCQSVGGRMGNPILPNYRTTVSEGKP